jgi:hypothetical protein
LGHKNGLFFAMGHFWWRCQSSRFATGFCAWVRCAGTKRGDRRNSQSNSANPVTAGPWRASARAQMARVLGKWLAWRAGGGVWPRVSGFGRLWAALIHRADDIRVYPMSRWTTVWISPNKSGRGCASPCFSWAANRLMNF